MRAFSMKKLGFTLSEVIIALGIVGVVAAITTPLISGIVPDKNKVAVLKLYKTISGINEQLLNTPAYYWKPTNNSSCVGFGCTQKVLIPELSDANGANKYPRLLGYHLDTEGHPSSSGFKTVDKMDWKFSGGFSSAGGSVTITIDTNDNGSTIPATAANKNKKIDTFKFNVDVNGRVTGGDNLTKQYLANPHKLNDRRNDYRKAFGG